MVWMQNVGVDGRVGVWAGVVGNRAVGESYDSCPLFYAKNM